MIRKIIVNFLIILLVTFFLGELSFRIFKPMPTYFSIKKQAGGFYKKSEFNTFTLLENYVGFFKSNDDSEKEIKITTNSQGFRNTLPNIKSQKKILILGDSYTFGVYIQDENTYSSQLSKLINDKYQYEIINAGYASGHNTDQQYSWLSNYLNNNECPETIILGFFLGNDFNINKNNWKKKDKKGFPIKYLSNNIYVDDDNFLRSKKKSIHTVATETIYKIPILRESHLLIAITKIIRRVERKIGGKSATGWDFNNFKFIYGEYDQNFLEKEKIIIDLITEINLKSLSCNGNFVVLFLPINFMLMEEMFEIKFPQIKKLNNQLPLYYDRLEKKLKNLNIKYINIYDLMKKDFKIKGINHFPNSGEVHFNSYGHYFTSAEIYNFLLNNKLIK